MPHTLFLTINGKPVTAAIEARTLLVDFLREQLQLTGTHTGCDTGQCGACTVHLDGHAVKACNLLALQAQGAKVVTIEGVSPADGSLHPMQSAFRDHHGLQCGFCTPGMVMSAIDLVRTNPSPTETEVREALDGNLCRCTGYHNIVQSVLAGAKAILTNTNIVSAYRGAGRPEAIYLIERLMDQAAAEMKIDPAELRRRNLIQPQMMPYTTPMGEKFDSGNFPHMLDRILMASDWKGFEQRRAESRARGKLRGRALSTFLEWTGVVHEETLDLHVDADGRVRIYTAMQAMGQGIETSYVQIVAETLDIDPECIDIVQGDSDVAQGLGSMGSRSLYIGGSAMFTASKQTIDKGRELASDALEAAGNDIEYRDGRFMVKGTDVAIGLFDLAAKQPDRRIAIKTLQKVDGPSWPNSGHVCEVEVDPETGVTKIVKYTTVDDVGRVINPMIVAGQVHGGIAQAVGQALLEDARYDPESGQLTTGSLLDYCVPRADDLPSIATFTDESTPCKVNPLGAKGVGELGTVGGTPTVINALLDALRPLGVKHIEMPATSERVWRAMREAKAA